MATKAKRESSTGGEVWFNDAVMQRVGIYGSIEVAEQMLVRELAAGLPFSHVLPDGTRVAGDARFFGGVLDGQRFILTVDRAENKASLGPGMPLVRPVSSDVPAKIFGIKVSRARRSPMRPAKTLIGDEAKRMKRDGEIREDILKTHFAKALASKAGVSSWRYVRNNLKAWGLWPVSDIPDIE
jgi:hypothetical protein